ncbi:DUF4244 domain-containing protein [Prauserella sp. PE36]|uniref:DUF4244 domain-containing protein n=1 Tax=Prauserella endophytica TaxID=1592324 RepID=A0ABY2S388_9PSEU|nr:MULTISPECIES: DUF4244 domain-containing protein [Prauserella]PXY34291.1 DUF4244 domain-containing protein [Prauserella coralliicola]RBM23055.1 DUF4244 domain-containing protein [Prauserella sp. PE36]TKG70019.1 DUF4244 domain-containing protein [Prauserella endophytica]
MNTLLRRRGPQPRDLFGSDDGMSTAEYAIGTLAAAAFAALLYTVITGDSVVSALTSLIERAISVSF